MRISVLLPVLLPVLLSVVLSGLLNGLSVLPAGAETTAPVAGHSPLDSTSGNPSNPNNASNEGRDNIGETPRTAPDRSPDQHAAPHAPDSAAPAQGASPVSIIDDTGRTITLPAPARRIIALYGGFNEILIHMGLHDRIIARTKADTHPPFLAALPSIGTHMRPNAELVAGLAPDCILQLGGRRQATEMQQILERLGFPVAFFQPATFGELFHVIERLGVLTGSPDRADALVSHMQGRLDAVTQALAHVPATAPTVFFEVRYPNLLGAGAESIVNDIILHAGGTNVLTMGPKLIRLNEEELVRLNPEAYLVQVGPMNPSPVPPAQRDHFRTLRAVTAGRVLTVDEQVYSRPGPRTVLAVEELARFLHPHAFDNTTASARIAGQEGE
ncbi:ABC transporter substrate-binding protein [Desulfovibrio psychrotolerans]|uniref:ABC transporter substrate-binding protein n=1 Tax=Desulfovibrio psychrotolerans TaxID=415242 RepID=UPI0028047C30|nr:ABC transporter substrate-binding protein [Desulfovibrio psychrotolerans]